MAECKLAIFVICCKSTSSLQAGDVSSPICCSGSLQLALVSDFNLHILWFCGYVVVLCGVVFLVVSLLFLVLNIP